MVKVVAPVALGTSLQMNGVSKPAPKAKRKTPSELRGEQLKRASYADQARDSFDALRPCKSMETENGIKKHLKSIELRMNELYPAKKARPFMSVGKENPKENGVKEQSSSVVNVSFLSNFAANKRQLLREEDKNDSAEVSNYTNTKARGTTESCSPMICRSVTELSTRGEELSRLPAIDMNKALKGLASCAPLPVHPGDITGKDDDASLRGNFMSEFHVPGLKIPLDLSMKTSALLVSSSPINWLHRSIMSSTYNGMPHLKSLSCNVVNRDNSSCSGSPVVSQVLNSMSLHSWVHPQSTLPSSVIKVLGSGKDGVDFLHERQLAWEDAFRSLYFMFRKNLCKIFYVCSSQFVAMFIGSCESGDVKRSCNAYITQSTDKLRDKLKELDICYSMPLCKTKMDDETTVEDLAELSEIEKQNIGQMQTRCLRSDSQIDNTPESFLAFDGNESVHGLYDLLLNYRPSLEFFRNEDVPVLYSPVPFQNAAMSSPEIKCKEMVNTDHTNCFLVEIKGKYIPPWIISNICANVVANGQNFEASFMTLKTSPNLNIGQPQITEETNPESEVREGTGENDAASGIPGVVICPQLRSGHLKSLKYCNKSYTVTLSPS